MALDVGTKRIGVAISDELWWTAQPLKVIIRKDDQSATSEIINLIKEHQVVKLIIGLPLTDKPHLSASAQKILDFTNHLQKHLDIPIETWDESLTSVEAEQLLITADLSRRKRKKVIDKLAAALILDSYLKAHSP